MEDIFYFTSPRKAVPVARYRPSVRRTPKVVRKRRAANTDMFNQQACVARFEEPTFCPSSVSSLLFPIASTQDTPLPSNSQFDLDLDDDEENEEDEHDDNGGVLLPPSADEPMTDVPSAHISTPVRYDEVTQHDINTYDNDTPIEPSIPPSILHLTSLHAQPQGPTQQRRRTASEEGHRRRATAREGQLIADALPPNESTEAANGAFVASLDLLSRPTVPALSTDTTQLQTFPSDASSVLGAHTTQRSSASDYTTTDLQHAQIMDMDEDALPVDDPRRHYDVLEFMDDWRLKSIADKRLPPFEPGIQSSIRLGRPLEPVVRTQVLSRAVDVQGIRWQLVGPAREQAMLARCMLHPSSTSSNYLRPQRRQTSSGIAGDAESHYRFRSFAPQHKGSFEHYQLRNMLVAADRNNIFYGTAANQVMRASLSCPNTRNTVMDLAKPVNTAAAFRITCLSASPRALVPGSQTDNVLIAGGFYGEYAVCNIDSDKREASEGFVTHAYNGLVTHVHSFRDRRSGLLRAAFSSNDRKVRLMDVGTLQFTDSFTYDHAVNCSATSADGRLRVLVGDSSDTLITDAQRGTPIVTLQEHTDHGFACAWSQDNRHVATAAQDGRVMVWDARSWKKPVRTFESTMSCARSLQFTDSGALVAAENEDVVTVYGGHSFEAKQEIRFLGSIAGVTLLDGGAELAIANADKTVGGLLTFERVPQGLGNNTYGRVVVKPGGSSRWRNGRARREMESLPEVLI
ncbi:hypothetical protein CB0940_04660 [Cercospora beticola]|uniref:Uncharacterized protein n=1 Tax=Cercospora beticola TaxID=122368 RepID=A0A2G5HMX9_CERBT|nr:hypothetical protein CB0940_04660 [Cercospora beticola]PIA93919.1 hypothetical protein CB0940_04660 [Cercospora beticola]WPB01920.1 hypothetical protein RHO25_006553 [Cercospora beticola]